MTDWESVGKSHFGALDGVEQFMQVYAARRVKALIDVIAKQPGCRRLTVNEGKRSRERQDLLYDEYLHHNGALAAVPYTSRHDEVLHGNAADLGGPNGEVLNDAEQAAIHTFGPALGISYTGPTFSPPELWHIEAATTPFTYTAATTATATTAATTAASTGDPTALKEEEDMPLNDADKAWIVQALNDKLIQILRSSEGRTGIAAETVKALSTDKDWGAVPKTTSLVWGMLQTLYKFAQQIPDRVVKATAKK